MIAFAVALLHPDDARSWERVSALLARTARSVFAQTAQPVALVVAGNRRPPGLPDRARFVELDLPPLGAGATGPLHRRDKGRKFAAAIAAALAQEPTHVMLLDADDLVHREVAAYAAARPDAAGWVVDRGYAWWEGSGRMTLVQPFHRLCGSSYVLASRLLAPAFAAPGRPALWGRPLEDVLTHHTRIADFFAEHGEPLRPLPFPGAVWVRGHGENASPSVGYLSILGRRIDERQRRDFGLPEPPGLAADAVASVRQAAATWRVARRRGLRYGLAATVGRVPVRLRQALANTPWEPREPPPAESL